MKLVVRKANQINTDTVHRNRRRADVVWRPFHDARHHAILRRCPPRTWKRAHISPTLHPPAPYSRRPITLHAQILFLGGLFLIIGPQKTFYFFARKNKLRGTACFLGGILLVFFKWPAIGVMVEMFGFLNLFGCVFIYLPPLRKNALLCLALSDLYTFFSFFLQGLFPCYPHFPPPTAIYRSVLEFTLHPTSTPINPSLFIRTISRSHSICGHVLSQLVDRLAGSRTSVV